VKSVDAVWSVEVAVVSNHAALCRERLYSDIVGRKGEAREG
jgi:hypothetical protein